MTDSKFDNHIKGLRRLSKEAFMLGNYKLAADLIGKIYYFEGMKEKLNNERREKK
jgi:hypothetical protein